MVKRIEIPISEIQIGDCIPVFGRYSPQNEIVLVTEDMIYTNLTVYSRTETITVFRKN